MSQHWLKPQWEPGLIVPDLPIKHFLDNGIKSLIVDVDGTLLSGKRFILDENVKDWMLKAKESFHLHIFSNNPSAERIGSVADQLELPYTCGAGKPRRNKLIKVIKQFEFSPSNIAIIGDRIFTDILVGNRLGLYTVLVHPLGEGGGTKQRKRLQIFERSLASWLGA